MNLDPIRPSGAALPTSQTTVEAAIAPEVVHEAETIINRLSEGNWTKPSIKSLGEYIVLKMDEQLISQIAYDQVMTFLADQLSTDKTNLLEIYGSRKLHVVMTDVSALKLCPKITMDQAIYIGKRARLSNIKISHIVSNYKGNCFDTIHHLLLAIKQHNYYWTLNQFIDALDPKK